MKAFVRARQIWQHLRLFVEVVIFMTGTTAIEMLYIERIYQGRLTIKDVPLRIRSNVSKTLVDMGYPELAEPAPAPVEAPVSEV